METVNLHRSKISWSDCIPGIKFQHTFALFSCPRRCLPRVGVKRGEGGGLILNKRKWECTENVLKGDSVKLETEILERWIQGVEEHSGKFSIPGGGGDSNKKNPSEVPRSRSTPETYDEHPLPFDMGVPSRTPDTPVSDQLSSDTLLKAFISSWGPDHTTGLRLKRIP